MTTVIAERHGDSYSLSCEGHATGSERTCAGISAIVYALEGWCINAGCIHDHKSSLSPGSASIAFAGGKEAQAAFDMAVIGLKQIEKTHGEYVKIILKN